MGRGLGWVTTEVPANPCHAGILGFCNSAEPRGTPPAHPHVPAQAGAWGEARTAQVSGRSHRPLGVFPVVPPVLIPLHPS